MSKQTRVDNFNNWPESKLFEAEIKFNEKLKDFKYKDLFKPCLIKNNDNKNLHIVISYLLDMVDSLPKRPDHSFDWCWKAFEHIATKKNNQNITDSLHTIIENTLLPILTQKKDLRKQLFNLTENIPLQTCEYLLKKILENGDFEISANFKPFTRRLLTRNGNQNTISNPNIQKLFIFICKKYNFNDNEKRRKGASLIKKALQGKNIEINLGENEIDKENFELKDNDILLILLSGISYSFRNDRTHAESISPFRSSTAKLKTYAHCWFLFLFVYEILNICFINSDILENDIQLADNIKLNNECYLKLFKSQLGK